MLERLLCSTYSALDRDPHAQIAFRARHADGLAWSVRDRVLTASTELGAPLLVLPLHGATIGDVVATLGLAGCMIVYQNPDLLDRAADSLLSGAGRQSQSNGDAFPVYDSLLWSMLDAYAVTLEAASVDVDLAVKQLYLGTAQADLLDVWGDRFGQPREEGETDDAYRIRILVETLRPRVNQYAIEKAIFDITGHVVELYEPWKDLFVLGESALSGGHFMQDGAFYTYNVVQPQCKNPIDWARPLQVIHRNRPVGTVISAPAFTPDPRHVSLNPAACSIMSRHDTQSDVVGSIDPAALGYLVLSGYETPLHYRGNAFQVRTLFNNDGAKRHSQIGRGLFFSKDHLCLSQDFSLGDVNAKFGHYFVLDTSDPMRLSGSETEEAYALSDSTYSAVVTIYDEVCVDVRAHVVDLEFASFASVKQQRMRTSSARRVPHNGWSGAWDRRTWFTDRIDSLRKDIPLP